jgi:hypothetical protein
MTAAPDTTAVQAYLTAQGASWDTDAVSAALAAEKAAQKRSCKIPQDLTDPLNPVDDYQADLAEALCRRVAANLANRGLPLGVQTQVAEFGGLSTRVGGLDREVRRLEGPFRKVILG